MVTCTGWPEGSLMSATLTDSGRIEDQIRTSWRWHPYPPMTSSGPTRDAKCVLGGNISCSWFSSRTFINKRKTARFFELIAVLMTPCKIPQMHVRSLRSGNDIFHPIIRVYLLWSCCFDMYSAKRTKKDSFPKSCCVCGKHSRHLNTLRREVTCHLYYLLRCSRPHVKIEVPCFSRNGARSPAHQSCQETQEARGTERWRHFSCRKISSAAITGTTARGKR